MATHYVPRDDADSISRLRIVLSDDGFLGNEAQTLPDADILRFAEAMMNTAIGAFVKLRHAFIPVGAAIERSCPRFLRWIIPKPQRWNEWDRLMAEAERR